MPISSTYQVPISPLGAEQIGVLSTQEKKDNGFNWIGFARIITTIAEIGLTLIPGVGPLAATGIAVGAAGIYTGLDVAQGSISGLNMGLTWGAAIIPGLSQAIGGAAKVSKVSKAIISAEEALAKAESKAGKLALGSEQTRLATLRQVRDEINIFTRFDKGTASIAEQAQKTAVNKLGRAVQKEGAWLNEIDNVLAKKFPGQDITIERIVKWFDAAPDKAGRLEVMSLFTENTGADFMKAYNSELKIQQIVGELDPKYLEQSLKEIEEITQSVLGTRRATAIGEAADDLQDDIRNWSKQAPEFEAVEAELRQVFGDDAIDALLLSIRNAPKSQQQSRVMDWIRQSLGREQAEQLILKIDNVSGRAIVKQNAPKGFISEHLYALKHPFGHQFADKWVQKLQLIDPNDIGRAPAEWLYKQLRQKMAKYIERAKGLEKSLKNLEHMREAFEKTGGTLVNSQRIIGYKVIHTVGVKTLIMIAFNPAPSKMGGTGATHRIWNGMMTKNYGGKEPVFVEATDMQLEMLRENGFTYYLDTWAYNHGGHPVGGKFFGMGGMLSGMTRLLPWINTTALRSWLSITSNWVENVADMARGEYGAQWTTKFIRSMKRTAISRGGRLLAQGFIRPVIGGRAGFFIGKEMQRVLGAVTTGLNNAQDMQRGTFKERWVKSFKSQMVPRGYQAAISYTNRAGRRKGAYGSQVMAASRKLSFLRRPISAVTPNSVLNPRQFTRFKV